MLFDLIFIFPCIMTQYTKMTNKMQLCTIIYYSSAALHVSRDIFVHHQEHQNCITAFGITYVCRCQLAATYVCNTRSYNTVLMFLMMSKNIARNMYGSRGIINYPTQLHLFGHFRILYSVVSLGKIWCTCGQHEILHTE